jgi:hypothetical protein
MRLLVVNVSFDKPNLTTLEWVGVAEFDSLKVWRFATLWQMVWKENSESL